MHKEAIIVNATALDRGGALSILRQFIDNIPLDSFQWLVFIPNDVKLNCKSSNVTLVPIYGTKPMFKRLLWDCFGLKRWLKQNSIYPIASISLQNTGFNVGKKVPSFVYYHQSIPFTKFSWNPFRKREKTFWFYKHIYPRFVKLSISKKTQIFVQLDYIKNGFATCFNHPKKNISVYSPNIIIPQSKGKPQSDSNSLKLFYPAAALYYKNHRVILEALKSLDIDLDVYFTTEGLLDFQTDKRIHQLGKVPYMKVCEMYEACDALLFPSYIETYGLPLIEAALIGMPIIVADLPYAREVLTGYEGATFVQYNNSDEWASAILTLKKGKRYKPIDISGRPGWNELFNEIKHEIK